METRKEIATALTSDSRASYRMSKTRIAVNHSLLNHSHGSSPLSTALAN